MNQNEVIAAAPKRFFGRSRLTKDIAEITAYVQRTKGMGSREAKRYVGRRLNKTTLANYRAARQLNAPGVRFPLGFRRAGKKGYRPAAPQVKGNS